MDALNYASLSYLYLFIFYYEDCWVYSKVFSSYRIFPSPNEILCWRTAFYVFTAPIFSKLSRSIYEILFLRVSVVTKNLSFRLTSYVSASVSLISFFYSAFVSWSLWCVMLIKSFYFLLFSLIWASILFYSFSFSAFEEVKRRSYLVLN